MLSCSHSSFSRLLRQRALAEAHRDQIEQRQRVHRTHVRAQKGHQGGIERGRTVGGFGRLITVGGVLIFLAWLFRPHDAPPREPAFANSSSAAVSQRSASAREVMGKKATYNERAVRMDLNDADAELYHRGLEHLRNAHGNPGTFTVAQVIDDENARERNRAEIADQAKSAAEARRSARVAAEEQHLVRGKPSCLVMDDRTIHSVSEEYHWSIVGKVVNRCDHDLSYVAVHVKFYDAAGNVESSGLTNMNNLGAGETWAFKKMVYENTSPDGRWGVEEVIGY